MRSTCFEYSVIESILKKDAPQLLHWLSDLEVEFREHTIVGCYINLVTNRQNKKKSIPGKVQIRLNGKVIRTGPKVQNPSLDLPGRYPRIGPDGKPTTLHNTGEIID